VTGKIRALTGPHGNEILSSGLLGQAGNAADRRALERIGQDIDPRRAQGIEQSILDAAGESSCEPSGQRGFPAATAQEGLPVNRACPRLIAREERSPDLHALGAERKGRRRIPADIRDASRCHDRHGNTVDHLRDE
jgi:hypothetical protein